MYWYPWPKTDAKGIARYVDADQIDTSFVGSHSWKRGTLLRKGQYGELVKKIYERLCQVEIEYDDAPYNTNPETQLIRSPRQVFTGREGTCLDLAVLFCSICLERKLLPALIVTRHHAFAAVSLKFKRDELRQHRGQKNDFIHDGMLDPSRLQEMAQNQDYLLVECTGFACGPGERKQLSFQEAQEAAATHLARLGEVDFVADIAVLHELGFVPFTPALADLPEHLLAGLYERISDQRRELIDSDEALSAFERALEAALASAVGTLAQGSEIDEQAFKQMADFVGRPEVMEIFASFFFADKENARLDLVHLRKLFQAEGSTIQVVDFDRMIAALLQNFERTSREDSTLASALAMHQIGRMAEDIRSGRAEQERQQRYRELDALVRRDIALLLEGSDQAEQLLMAPWGELLLHLYHIAVARFATDQAHLELFCDWLEWHDLDGLVELTQNRFSSLSSHLASRSVWPKDEVSEWMIQVDKLLGKVEFTWIYMIRQSLSLRGLDRLFEIRLFIELQEYSSLAYRTWGFVKVLPEERHINLERLRQRSDDIRLVLRGMVSLETQQQRIDSLLFENPNNRLIDLGFYDAEMLLALKRSDLPACRPLPLQLQKRSGFAYWPLACDIREGVAIATEALKNVRKIADQSNMLYLNGKSGTGKTTCARMYAYESVSAQPQRRSVYYFGNLGQASEADSDADMVERYARLPIEETIDLLRKADDPLVILDDIQYNFEVVEQFVRRFKEELRGRKLILISTFFSESMSDAGERLFTDPTFVKIEIRQDWRDVQQLLRNYWPPQIALPKQAPREDVAKMVQRRASYNWSLLHVYVSMFDYQQYERMAYNQPPYFNTQGLTKRLVDQSLLKLPESALTIFWEICALGSLQLPVFEEYVNQDKGRKQDVTSLLNQGYLFKKNYSRPNRRSLAAYTLHLPLLAEYFLEAAYDQRMLRGGAPLSGEQSSPTVRSKDDFIVRTMARYLLARPSNYDHVLLSAFSSRREDLLQELFNQRQPWHKALLDCLLELIDADEDPTQVARALNLLRRVSRALPRELLMQNREPGFRVSEFNTRLRRKLNSLDAVQIQQGMLALRYLRMAERKWARDKVVELVVSRSVMARQLTQGPFSLAAQLFAEVYSLNPQYARDVLEQMARDGQKALLRERVLKGLSVPLAVEQSSMASSSDIQPEATQSTSIRLIEATSFLASIALADYEWVNKLLDEIGTLPFTHRVMLGIEPPVLVASLSHLFRVSPSFTYQLYEQWQQSQDVMLVVAASFASRLQRFSESLRSLHDLSDSVPRFARSIFRTKPMSEWKEKWQATPYVSEFHRGMSNLLAFDNDGATRLLSTFSAEELAQAVQQSLTPGLLPYFLSGLIFTLANIQPHMIGELLQTLDLEQIIDIFRNERARLPSIALLLVGLSHVRDNEQQVLEVWSKLSDYIESGLSEFAKSVNIAKFYVTLKNHLVIEGYAQVQAKIADTANELVENKGLERIISNVSDLISTSDLINGVGAWADRDLVKSFVYDHESLLKTRLRESRDVTEMGSFLLVIGKLVSEVHRRLINELDWKFIIDDIKHEFKLGRVVLLIEGLAATERVGDDITDEIDIEDAENPSQLSQYVQEKLHSLAHEFVTQIDDEPNLSIIANLFFALWRTVPKTAVLVSQQVDEEKLLARLRAEVRIAVICKLLSGFSKVNPSLESWLKERLSDDPEALTIKLFLEPRNDLFALDLFRLHHKVTEASKNQPSAANKILANQRFDKGQLAERLERDKNNRHVAILLYNLSVIDRNQANDILGYIKDITVWIRSRSIAEEPSTVALLFALRMLSRRRAKTFAEHLMRNHFLAKLTHATLEPRLVAWAVRELVLSLGDSPLRAQLETDIAWANLRNQLLKNWTYDFSTWEVGWCLWALNTGAELHRPLGELKQALLARQGFNVIRELFAIDQPLYRAFGVLGFGVELARQHQMDWISMARDLQMKLQEPPGNLLIYNDEKDNSLEQIARLIGERFDEGNVLPQSDVFDHMVWTLCWRWFRLGDFSFRDV